MKCLVSTTLEPFKSSTENQVSCYRSVANEDYVAVSLTDGSVHVLSSANGAIVQRNPFYQAGVLFSGLALDGHDLILSHAKSHELTIYSIPSGEVLHTIPCHDNKGVFILSTFKLDPNTCIVGAFHFDGSVSVVDVRSKQVLRVMDLHSEIAHSSAVFGDTLATSSPDGTFAVTDWETGHLLWKKTLGEGEKYEGRKVVAGNAVFAQAIHREKVVAGTKDGRLIVFELRTGKQHSEWQASTSMTQKLFFHENSLVQMSWGELKIWSFETYDLLNAVRIFDRVATDTKFVNGLVICCGRDAAEESDLCGLEFGLKAWRYTNGSSQKDKPELERAVHEQADSGKVFQIGSAVRAATGLEVLGDDQIAVSVLRGAKWSVELWQV